MYKLTAKEEEVMEMIWKIGPCAPKDVRALYTKPIPNINTVAASFQSLERKGYLTHEQRGRGYLYIPIIKQEDYGKSKFRSFVDRYFDGSFKKIVNSFIQDEELSREELIQLLEELETSERNSR
ncbi:MAG: BlaI/MecI/CopY family transcriptional regulator [Bacteroidaceae bacterium]|nr:BlaI/MecI/CopY family transcriptional regulator [Bacteroidaceae bacterium]